ncbi:MAG: ATP-grasp domain-containing protein [Clostridiales bacterium]|nr:ATP-grasp domain-containing protein [Clostridiales bacterium]
MNKLKPITVLITAAGCPGASTCIRYLKGIEERQIKIVGVDAEQECIGRFLVDDFRKVPMAIEPDYVDELFEYAVKQEADCILIPSSYEVEVIAAHRERFENVGIKVLASSPESLKRANNKRLLYETFKDDDIVKVPDFRVVHSLDEFVDACEVMGYPERKLCFKPPFSKGSRGFRYLASDINRADLLLNYKPDSKIITLNEMIDIFDGEDEFPELLLMETIIGEEIDSMVLADAGDPLLITHKTRELERGGVITMGGHCVRPDLDKKITAILKKVKLSYNIGIQFKGGYLMEINPRLSTFLYTRNWVEPYFAVKFALGELNADEVRAMQAKVPMTLRMLRYFDQCFFDAAATNEDDKTCY